MKTLKSLEVQVTYRVSLIDVEVPDKVYDQIIEADENLDEIDPSDNRKYPEAGDWLIDNIKEADCTDWSVEIDDVS